MKILINTPSINELGGVANHYKGLKNFWTQNVRYNTIGSRKQIPGIVLLPIDIAVFIIKCLIFRPDVVLLNPSLGKRAFYRDAIYLKIACVFKLRTIVFFHGWDSEFEQQLSNNTRKFIDHYGHASAFLVLASEFKTTLESWGVKKPIYLTTTKVDDKLLSNFEITQKKKWKEHSFLIPNN